MIVSPSNIIDGIILMMKANTLGINKVIRQFDPKSSLHIFKGVRNTLPLESFPSLEFDATTGGMDWVTTSAMTGEYTIDCVLTIQCGTSPEKGLDYISELTRKILSVINYPPNMSWRIPNEFLDKEKTKPILCQYSDVRSVDYLSAKNYAVRISRWQMQCKTVEPFPVPISYGPQRVEWRETKKGDSE